MSAELATFLIFLSFLALLICALLVALNYDRMIVTLMRGFNIRLYPTAIAIAMLIEKCPEQWTGSAHHLSHPDIGDIWTANGAYGLYVDMNFGRWKPNAIERRIICDAVDWRMGLYIRNRVQKAMERKAIG